MNAKTGGIGIDEKFSDASFKIWLEGLPAWDGTPRIKRKVRSSVRR